MVGTGEITFEEVVDAGRVLFGPAFAVEALGWREALKTTYRRRAMQTHPDRARALGRPERELAREFKAVSEAYRILAALRAGPLPRLGHSPPRPVSRPAPRQAARPAERAHVHRAPAPAAAPASRSDGAPRVRVGVRPEDLPQRRLRFAEYLYYSGRVRWTELVAAIAWQRAQRPPVGRIAVDFGFLAPEDVAVILERRREAAANSVPFGEWAVRLGYLTSFQLLAVLGQQLRRQRPIGAFFVERGFVEADEIDAIRRRILRHNARF
ncbi:MAG TPA: DnaJ domain-containing protein [Anaeromyxobacter sp.]